jgi:diguanylate cyclase (GGDEF)-like protein/PAS domain S-box-containing protein
MFLILTITLGFVTVTSYIIITIIRNLKSKLHQSNSRFQNMIESNQDLVWETDKDGFFSYVSPTFKLLLGYSKEDILGKAPTEFMSEAEIKNYHQTFDDYVLHHKPYQLLHKTVMDRSGHLLILQSSGIPLFNAHNEFQGYQGFDRDITQQEKDKEIIEHLAFHDQLTGLPNRKAIEKILMQELSRAQRHKRFGALFFIDLDNFKRINDSLGHHVGDQLLQKVSQRIQKYIREEDTIGRLGGDEFILLLPELSHDENKARDQASNTAYKILSLLSIPVEVENHILNIGGSLGITLFPSDSKDIEKLMKNADTAMYAAKNNGKNTFSFFHQNLHERMQQRISIEEHLRTALDKQQLELYYQPQYDIFNNQLIAIEVLIRWHHPNMETISPDQFISVAEETGLILKLGNWILEEACRQNKAWCDQGLCRVPIAINLSPTQFRQTNLKQTIVNVLTKTQMPAELLEIELKEDAIMLDYNLAMDTLQMICSMGGKVAIDDFGTGYTNFSMLKNLPVNKIKIDKSFISELEKCESNRKLCQAIINMAKALKLAVTAEGVETRAQLEFLKNHGSQNAQGYYFSKPLPANEFEAFVKDFNNRQTDPD